jgi:hypothetical protein
MKRGSTPTLVCSELRLFSREAITLTIPSILLGMFTSPHRIATMVFCLMLAVLAVAQGQDPSKSTMQGSSNGTLEGSVQDAFEHASITPAYILVHRDARDIRVSVNSLGRYSVELAPGFYDVFVSARGFDPACQKVRVEAGKTGAYDPALKASNLENTPD